MKERFNAFIPTNSLFQIHEKIGDKLDSIIWGIRARHQFKGAGVTVPLNDYMSVNTKPTAVEISLSYEQPRQKQSFSMDAVAEAAVKAGAQDLWVDRMVFYVSRPSGGGRLYTYFENTVPKGAEVTDLVMKLKRYYLKKHGLKDEAHASRRRILSFRSAESEEHNIIDPMQTNSRSFIEYLTKTTKGLVMMMQQDLSLVRVFKDKNYDFVDTIWRREAEEAEIIE